MGEALRALEHFVDTTRELAGRFRRYTLRDEDWAREGAQHHARILALVEDGQNEEAAVLRRRLAESVSPGGEIDRTAS